MKLTQFLEEEGYKFSNDERIQVYLTDTLDDAKYKNNPLFPYMSDETKMANRIKLEDKIWVIIGNPPYSNYSKNKKHFIESLMTEYKIGLKEKKQNWDDYVKFMRYAQVKITGGKYQYEKRISKGNKDKIIGEIKAHNKGVIGIITNNSFLEGSTHPVMRKSLIDTFDKIYIL
ncbi:MAG TPA: hypothetical protein VN922_21775, partial [Bacteroidia bacterium]|nr:hypothetical protein [Bacteroidia bacterium]